MKERFYRIYGKLTRGMSSCKVEIFENGTASIRNLEKDEAMHSRIGPEAEARAVYIEPSDLPARLSASAAGSAAARGTDELVIFDLGLGIAANALLALECCLATPAGSRRRLRVISFECSLEGIELALRPENSAKFPLLHRNSWRVTPLLKDGRWHDDGQGLSWDLIPGDFSEKDLASLPAPELVFFDFYSPKACPELWGWRIFKKLFDATRPRRDQGRGTLLLTYSAATHVRAAMLLAGFHVGYGSPTQAKLETTIATTLLSELTRPLGTDWLRRFSRSRRPLPADLAKLPPARVEELRKRIQRSIVPGPTPAF